MATKFELKIQELEREKSEFDINFLENQKK
jgi:hypothetical protein